MPPQTCLRQHLLCTQAGLAVQAGLRQILPRNETVGVSEPDIIAMGLHARAFAVPDNAFPELDPEPRLDANARELWRVSDGR